MALEKIIYALLTFVVISTAFVLLVVDVNDQYSDVDISTSRFDDVNDTLNETFILSQDMKNALFGTDVDDTDSESSLFKGAIKAIRFVKASFKLTGNILNSIARELRVPAVFVGFALAGLAVFILFSIVYLVFRFKPRN